MKKPLILVTAALLMFAFFALDLNRYLTLDGMKASLGQFEAQRAASPVAVSQHWLRPTSTWRVSGSVPMRRRKCWPGWRAFMPGSGGDTFARIRRARPQSCGLAHP